jgi:hypothetical protein
MYVTSSNKSRYVCSRCRKVKIPIVDLEVIYHEQLRQLAISPGEVERHVADANVALTQRQRLLDVLAAERDKVSAEPEQVYALYMAKGLDKEDFAVRHRLEARGILGNVSTGGAPLSPSRSPTAGAAPRSEGGIECWSPAATVGRA